MIKKLVKKECTCPRVDDLTRFSEPTPRIETREEWDQYWKSVCETANKKEEWKNVTRKKIRG